MKLGQKKTSLVLKTNWFLKKMKLGQTKTNLDQMKTSLGQMKTSLGQQKTVHSQIRC